MIAVINFIDPIRKPLEITFDFKDEGIDFILFFADEYKYPFFSISKKVVESLIIKDQQEEGETHGNSK